MSSIAVIVGCTAVVAADEGDILRAVWVEVDVGRVVRYARLSEGRVRISTLF